jgi:N-methylhydantoinase A/oxoprolinase/acetone carboxylase beta subunit
VLEVMTEQMAQAVEEVSTRRGVAPASAALVAGGGSSGFNCVAIARRVHSSLVLVPELAPGLSAAGALLSDLTAEVRETLPVTTAKFDYDGVNAVLSRLRARCQEFLDGPAVGTLSPSIEFFAEARYPDQVWELEVPMHNDSFASPADVEAFRRNSRHASRVVRGRGRPVAGRDHHLGARAEAAAPLIRRCRQAAESPDNPDQAEAPGSLGPVDRLRCPHADTCLATRGLSGRRSSIAVDHRGPAGGGLVDTRLASSLLISPMGEALAL